ncbi:MAG TPA: AEC family transporter [Clostridiaceae bacterium]|nr:AEC family transporter [Clostridiaceae bacterium]
MSVSVVLESIITLFIMILVGIYARRRNIITEDMNKGLINILIQIALPFMILSSFLHTYDDTVKENIVKTIYYSLGAYVIMAGVSYLLLWPVKNDKKTILHFANVFVNTGYVGFPILNSMYGPEGVVYGSIFNMLFVLFLWTYGIILFKGRLTVGELRTELRKVLLNPSIHAVCVGLLVMFLDVKLPGAITSASRGMGNLTGPLSMIIIGCILSRVNIKMYLRDWTVYYGVIVKLIIIPMIIYLAASLTETSSIAINSVIVMTSLPASAMTSIFADTFDKEKEYAAFYVSITTMLSLFTVLFFIRYVL